MRTKSILLIILTFIIFKNTLAQQTKTWNNKECAVILTYDDALNVHLDNVIPTLDALSLKGTFYLIGGAAVVSNRIPEWRLAALHGHELGNHSLLHPCDGSLPGRSWVTSETDLNNYTLQRAVNEIRITNTLLKAIDGKTERTFAFPCGDILVENVSFYDDLKIDFVGARGTEPVLQGVDEINLDSINAFVIDGHTGDYMIDLVKKAIESNTLLVFLFHGVGGEHPINVSLEAHNELLQFLKQQEQYIWNAPLVDVANYVKENQ